MINIPQLTTHNYSKGLIALTPIFSFRLPFAGISKVNKSQAIFLCCIISHLTSAELQELRFLTFTSFVPFFPPNSLYVHVLKISSDSLNIFFKAPL